MVQVPGQVGWPHAALLEKLTGPMAPVAGDLLTAYQELCAAP